MSTETTNNTSDNGELLQFLQNLSPTLENINKRLTAIETGAVNPPASVQPDPPTEEELMASLTGGMQTLVKAGKVSLQEAIDLEAETRSTIVATAGGAKDTTPNLKDKNLGTWKGKKIPPAAKADTIRHLGGCTMRMHLFDREGNKIGEFETTPEVKEYDNGNVGIITPISGVVAIGPAAVGDFKTYQPIAITMKQYTQS